MPRRIPKPRASRSRTTPVVLAWGLAGPAALALAPCHLAQAPATQLLSGLVTDDANQPLPGVTVLVKGTTTGTATDAEGRFQLRASAPAVLVPSFVDFETRERFVPANQTSLTVALRPAVTGLSNVVVGYGTAKRENLTTAVASLPNPEKQANHPITSVQGMLQGNVANSHVAQNQGW